MSNPTEELQTSITSLLKTLRSCGNESTAFLTLVSQVQTACDDLERSKEIGRLHHERELQLYYSLVDMVEQAKQILVAARTEAAD